ncbi:MAG TPA: ROK family protein [Acidimicrobiia bacterium]|nr:ROK family protein [Acidimicrobiia bacterium]
MTDQEPDPPTIGVDLGATNVRSAVVDRGGRILAEVRAHTGESGANIVPTTAGLVRDLARDFPEANAVGVGAAGLVDRDGAVHYAPNIPAFRRTPLRKELEAAVGLPVIVDNDANAAAWGEVVHGAAKGVLYALMITLGTGIGGGIIARGRVIRGAHGFAAEVGHFQIDPDGPVCACGERGHWEAYASGSALGRMGRQWAAAGRAPSVLARAAGDPAAVTGVHVGDSAQAGEADGLALLEEYADLVAVGLAGLANILDPERIVISGGLVALGDTLFVPLRTAFARRIEGFEYRPSVAIVPSVLGDHAGVIGAAARARDLEPIRPGVERR